MFQKAVTETRSASMRIWLANFLQRNRSLLIFVIVAVLVCLGGLAVWSVVNQSTHQKFATKVEQLEANFDSWKTEADPAKKTALAKTVEDEISSIQKQAPLSYGLLKAYFIQGQYFVEQKQWLNAAKAYKTVFEKDSSSYLAPISLLNSAVCLDDAVNLNDAASQYELFLQKYADDKILAPQVYFSLGRLYESENNPAKATTMYKTLTEKFPDSDWTKLARDRVLVLAK